MSFTAAELQLLRLSDIADSYAYRPGRRARVRGGKIGRDRMPLSEGQRQQAEQHRAAGLSWYATAEVMHISADRLRREMGAA